VDSGHFENGLEHADTTIIGACGSMQRVQASIDKIASANDIPVLITGESGTGKELVAKAIHSKSARCHGPQVTVNCGALPPSLIHAELFGYEKGAFTGAHRRHIGHLEAADSGTVFLDEIGELPLDLQVNLLRFIQERTIERLGSTTAIYIDTRIIAATNIDLVKAADQGRFRKDLFYRLNVLELQLPPLRQRGEDIVRLAEHYLHVFAQERSGEVLGFSQQALQRMRDHSWPGNIRELVNRIHRAIIMYDGLWITSQELGFDQSAVGATPCSLADARREADKRAIMASLQNCDFNISAAARQLNITRTTLYRLMNRCGVAQSTCAESVRDTSARQVNDV
jgi:DNA-binding NtrC family response regulator